MYRKAPQISGSLNKTMFLLKMLKNILVPSSNNETYRKCKFDTNY